MNIGSIILFVKNMRTVVAFYQDVIGLAPDDDQSFPPHRFFRFDTGQCKLCLHSASKPNGGRQKIVFNVESVKATHDDLKAKGVRLKPLKRQEDAFTCFDISDPEGNRIQFWGEY